MSLEPGNVHLHLTVTMLSSSQKRSRRRRNRNQSQNSDNQTLTIPRSINGQRARYHTTVTFTGGNVTPATTTGYAYLVVSSSLWTSSSPWTQLAALYQFVRPLGASIEVTFNRATGTTDNPRVAFVPTPAGTPVGNLGMNLSTFESALGKNVSGGPGTICSFRCSPSVLVALYNTVISGYMSMRPGALTISSLPLVYYGDLLLYTPGILLSSVTNYVTIKIKFDFEFSVLTSVTQ